MKKLSGRSRWTLAASLMSATSALTLLSIRRK